MQCYHAMAAVYDRLMADVPYAEWVAFVLSLWHKHGFCIKTIADVACGTGNLTIRLARAGYAVTGIDASGDMLSVAADKARRNGKKIPFVCQDMCALTLHQRVDAVVAGCDGVNYLTDGARLRAFFAAARDALVPGGAFVFDVSSAYKLREIIADNMFGEDDGEVAYLWRNAYDARSRTVDMELSLFIRRGDGAYERFTEGHVQRAWERAELEEALREEGFIVLSCHDGYQERAADEKSERLVYVARRSA